MKTNLQKKTKECKGLVEKIEVLETQIPKKLAKRDCSPDERESDVNVSDEVSLRQQLENANQ